MAIRGKTRENVIDALRAQRPFRTGGSLRAVDGDEGTGLLPEEHARQFRSDRPRYVVYSYATPIAWVTASGLVRIPDVKYSVTTTPQQTMCRVCLVN